MVKTPLGMERVAASRIRELDDSVEVNVKPDGYSGIVLVKGDYGLASKIKSEVLEAEKVMVADEVVEASIESVVSAAVRVAKEKLVGAASFAVRTTRRGKHDFTSVDVNVKTGAAVKSQLEIPVDLENPDKVLFIEIIGNMALVGVMDGAEFYRKNVPGKHPVLPYLRKATVVQIPYLGPPDATREMGVRVGREVQTFEVGELVVAFIGSVDARSLYLFLDGVFEGIRSRLEIQQRTYARKPHKVPVYVQDLYQLVRDRMNEPIVVFEPEGEPIPSVAEKLASFFVEKTKRVNLLIGSREGVPSGIFRF